MRPCPGKIDNNQSNAISADQAVLPNERILKGVGYILDTSIEK